MNRQVEKKRPNRREVLLAAAAGGVLASCSDSSSDSEEAAAQPSLLGEPLSAYGERSPFETAQRAVPPSKTPEEGSSLAPIGELRGVVTPSSLHFERHHAGIPTIDPTRHELLIHGLVERPLIFTMEDLRRLPSVSRLYFIECSGNSRSEWKPGGAPTAQMSHGLASCSEWTGVPLAVVLEEAGIRPEARWLLAEGADACQMSRSVPIEKALDDALLAYGQNGEALRPAQGYPLRLVLPGWEGNTCVKWLRRIQAAEQPFMTRDETSKYTDLQPGGKARQFSYEMEAKSVIIRPSGGQQVGKPGFYEISGLAWSGRGRIERVEVTVDGGRTWQDAELDAPRLEKAFTRFRLPWRWEGGEVIVASRSIDETGYRQPLVEELLAVRGPNSDYHNNAVKFWRISAEGEVTHAEA